MYRVNLYIGNDRVDLFDDEEIVITRSVQNIKDISKVFGDFSKGISLPASKANNAIFSHYYNVDVLGGFNAALKVDAFIEINENLYSSGKIELEGVKLKNGEPYSYNITYYSKTTALKDLFGEDKLNDLDFSSLDHSYNDTNLIAGLDGYVSGTSENIIYPLISPVTNWRYNTDSSDEELENIHFHNANHPHGVQYYDLKPAIRLAAIVDAIEAKYGVTFTSTFFSEDRFTKLFMWCHRREGFMFKNQPYGKQSDIVNFTSSGGSYNLTTQSITIEFEQETNLRIILNTNSTSDYKIQVYINGEISTNKNYSGSVTNDYLYYPQLNVGDTLQIRFAVPDDWGGEQITLNSISATFEYYYLSSWNSLDTASRSTSQSIINDVVISEQMPEQKLSDFLGNLVRMFNLVIVPTNSTTYEIEPLDDWRVLGSEYDITDFVDVSESEITKPNLYRRIAFNYNETEYILGENFRNTNTTGYGDVNADFAIDGDEFKIDVSFDNMLFERLSDVNPSSSSNTGLTDVAVGKAIDKNLEPNLGSPIVFYLSGKVTGSSYHIGYVNMDTSVQNTEQITSYWIPSNVDSDRASGVANTINFGTENDPYLLQGVTSGLYQKYWKNYITTLYNANTRVYKLKAFLPFGVMLFLKLNDSLMIQNRRFSINQMNINISSGEADLELINDAE